MSHFLDRLRYFSEDRVAFAGNHGVVTSEDRTWEDGYRQRWAHDKIVRSTHGTNCTGSCSWKIYVKGGIVTWETQQTDYPRTRPDMPNHEPRGCSRGASYSWYLYSANRIKYPMVRSPLIKLWRAARPGGSGTETGEKLGHHHLDSFLPAKVQIGRVHTTEKMDDIRGLRFVPPAQVIDLHADGSEGGAGLLNLDLKTTVHQQERMLMVDENLHAGMVRMRKATWVRASVAPMHSSLMPVLSRNSSRARS